MNSGGESLSAFKRIALSRPQARKSNCGFSTMASELVTNLKTRISFLHRFSITLFFYINKPFLLAI